jgi:hypothetical protein
MQGLMSCFFLVVFVLESVNLCEARVRLAPE